MTREQFSIYMAGVVDSDGSLSIAIRHRRRTKVNFTAVFQLTWTDTDKTRLVFDRLKATYGGSYAVCVPSGKKQYPNTKNVIKYMLVSRALEPFIDDVLPFLQLKKDQAINIKKLRANIQMPTDEQQQLYTANKAINTKNKIQVLA